MEDSSNTGVCCDVSSCKYNEKGCNCKKGTIKITSNNSQTHHFCKSYKDKNS